MKSKRDFPELLQLFFTDYMVVQRKASIHTLGSYRDMFRLLLEFAKQKLKKEPSNLLLSDLHADFLVSFLNDLEAARGIGARSRNQRLAALRTFFRYAAYQAPEYSGVIVRVLAIPAKRHDQELVSFLDPDEVEALLAAPDQSTWTGRRDFALLSVAVQTGLRVSELKNLTRENVILGRVAHVRCFGKGRKERCTPLTQKMTTILQRWSREIGTLPSSPIFPNARGAHLSSDGIQFMLRKYVAIAAETRPSLKTKRVSPHVLRHTAAVRLLHSGVDRSVIALWLGHSSMETTDVYLDADLTMKEEALEKTSPIPGGLKRFKPSDELLGFLRTL